MPFDFKRYNREKDKFMKSFNQFLNEQKEIVIDEIKPDAKFVKINSDYIITLKKLDLDLKIKNKKEALENWEAPLSLFFQGKPNIEKLVKARINKIKSKL